MKTIPRIAAVAVGILLAAGITVTNPVGVQPAQADMSSIPSDQVALGKMLQSYHDSGLLTTYCTVDAASNIPCATNIGGTNAIYQQEILPLAQGQVPTPGAPCSVDTRILQLLVLTIDHFQQRVNVTDLERYCVGSQLSKVQHGAQAGHGGWAIDIDSIGGTAVNGSSTKDAEFLAFLLSIKPLSGSLHVGQTQCAQHVNYTDFSNFQDDCTHQHIDFSSTQVGLNVAAGPSTTAAPYGVTTLVLPSDQISLYAIRNDGNLWGNTQQSAGGSFNGWQMIGGPNTTLVGRPSVIRTSSNLIAAYARTNTGTIVGTSQSSQGGSFSAWQAIGTNGGGIVSDPAAIQLRSGLIAIYASTGTSVSGVNQTSVGGGFGSWTPIGSTPVPLNLRPSVAQLSDDRIVIYSHSTNGQIYGTAQSLAGSAFQQWQLIGSGGGSGSEPSVYVGSDGRISLYATNGTSLIGVTQPGAGQSFGAWINYGNGGAGLGTTPALVPLSNGTVALYARASDSTVVGTVLSPGQTSPSGWAGIGGTATLVATAVTAKLTGSNLIVVYGSDTNGAVVGTNQGGVGGNFGPWVPIS